MKDIEKIKLDLKNMLSTYRYEHSIRVAEEARKLALHYGINEDDSYLAGLLHDIAKEFSNDDNKLWIEKYDLDKCLLEDNYKKICHAVIGALVAKELYNVDKNIVNAIKYHTIGNINMDILAKIIFVADKIEIGKDYLGIEEERRLAYINIDKALILCLENTQNKLSGKGMKLHSDTIDLLNYLKNNISN